ncbi:nitrite reductase (NADH) large subunit [Gracilibacillus ureilyticus]|uniref:Nitrite reductase (NADH) large subunit n=1 Tax=Gracilibacillus ureilyticus TaxID=531814 RepID=A0A1H9TQM9_9BACI|nr:nitrite reductase large subunit NirB [Gracilibacillus ureilyticus]SER98943.1 nitrite reductase (NADH) large subunit [Gracilibacillus ureilyticus]
MGKEKLILIGNGMAGLKCIEQILKEDSSLYHITIFGSEPYTNYSRIMLSSVLQGNVSFNEIILNDWDWYERNEITLYPNETVHLINSSNKTVSTSKRQIAYDKLIIATGSVPFILPVPGSNKEGVMAFRTIDDCKRMIDTAKSYKKAAVIGGGILGLEAARGLLNLGMEVSVIHLADRLMNNQLDEKAAAMLQRVLTDQGMSFLLKKETAEFIGKDRVEGIRFTDGSELSTDLVVMAAGIKPNTELAINSGIQTNRGIVINEWMETNQKDIFAVGECAEHKGIVYGLVKPLYEQGEILAKYLCRKKTEPYTGSVLSTQLKVSGVDVFSVGNINTSDDTTVISAYDEVSCIYKKVLFKENKVIGAVLFGETSSGPRLLDIIKKKKFTPDKEKANLLQPVNIEDSYAACLKRDAHVCTCNNVTKGNIIDNVLSKDLQTVDEIKSCTKASSSCGGCKPVVKELLAYIRSDHFYETTEELRFCSCTELSEDDVISEIQTRNLSSIDTVRKELRWKTLNGCPHCEAALLYYLEMIYPENNHDQQFIYVDENINATKQHNGSYTIIPQLYGGTVTGEQLLKISEVVLNNQLSPAKIKDNRIILHDVPERKFISVCKELNMKLFSFTDNMIKSVEVDTSPSALSLATFIEEKTEYLKMPCRIDMEIIDSVPSGQAMISKDIYIISANDFWEIYVYDPSVYSHNLLTVTRSLKDTQKIVLSFIQYYRQSASFNESIGNWANRVGLVHIREALFNKELQNLLLARLMEDQSIRKKKTVK